ncbi:MAG: extracellular solute-binding protein [Nitrospiraceae bacterium]|nr:MAG: extracellular solute-binding protein [Nitrospiraceae bacterium]
MVILAGFSAFAGTGHAEDMIVCASTTSTQNSGLFDYLLPLFQKKRGITVKVVAVGTGAALEIGKRGDADVLLVHAKDDELKMVEEGWFVNRHDLMYNDFVIAGPPSDPAGVRGMKDAKEALGIIASAGSVVVSRGDDSGTNKKEISLWSGAGIDPRGKAWYLEVGQGMTKTLRIAGEKQAYTLSDRGTYLSVKDKESIDLAVLVEGDPLLYNQYGVMAVNPEKHKHVRAKAAAAFIDWLISEEGQKAIASFTDGKGNQLFFPNAGK